MIVQTACLMLATTGILVHSRTILPSYDVVPESEVRTTLMIEDPDKRLYNSSKGQILVNSLEWKGYNFKEMCHGFAHYPGQMTIGGDSLSKVGDGYSAQSCKQSCLDMREFVCTGSLIQTPGTCFLTGYKLMDDFYSVHYTRTCNLAGPRCYSKQPYTTAGFTQMREVPYFLSLSDGLAESYCMTYCDDDQSCLGFDIMTTQAKKIQCLYLNLFKVSADSFDFFIRRC